MSERKPLTDEQLDDIWKEMLKPDAKNPPRIDRSAWEPCEECKEVSYWDEKCDNCRYDDLFANQEPCASCESKSKWEPYYSFCPQCGRPLTDEAWEMLERRLTGRENQ